MKKLITEKTRLRDAVIWFGLMFIMFLCVGVAAERTGLLLDEEIMHECLFGIIGMMFLFVLYSIRFMGEKQSNAFGDTFDAMTLVLFAIFYTDTVLEMMNGSSESVNMMVSLATWEYFLSAAFYLLIWIYITRFFEKSRKEKIYSIIVISLCSIYALNALVNIKTHHMFVINNRAYIEYMSAETHIITTIMAAYYVINIVHIIRSGLSVRIKKALGSFFIFPILCGIFIFLESNKLQPEVYDIIENYAMLLSLYLIFFNIHVEERNRLSLQQAENAKMRESIVASQIGPHFLYNALATISAVCEEEGAPQAGDAVNKFAAYLRMNLDSLGETKLVKFEKELEHIETYLWIEQMRFGDDLKVEYDIQVSDFELPPLTVQPIVENAVSHGVLKKIDGGTVKIATSGDDENIVITVSDDGVGFDVNAKLSDDRNHIGMSNVRTRLESFVNGRLEIKSVPGEGTVAVISIPKGGK